MVTVLLAVVVTLVLLLVMRGAGSGSGGDGDGGVVRMVAGERYWKRRRGGEEGAMTVVTAVVEVGADR